MKLFNTLGRQLNDFKPHNSDQVKIYSCGPTVYNYAHIGNLRSFIFADTLRRTLEESNYKVKQVMNITDVGHLTDDGDAGEDKLEKGAIREGKSVEAVSQHFTNAFLNDIKELNILPPNGYKDNKGHYARATDFIEEQLNIVKLLLEKGYAYQTEQAIYFDVTKVPDYGKLSGQKLSDKEVGAREDVVVDNDKHHPYDFAVWFFTVGRFKNHSLHWNSPWGDGFPGWHLECSAIIHKTLGEPIDIHTGGVDHIGTHHTNEIAQTEAAFGSELSKIWMHNEFVLVDGAKMAKSSGNFYTLKDIKEKGFDPIAFRLWALSAHYRSELNFTWESMQAAQNRLNDLRALAVLRWQTRAHTEASSYVLSESTEEFVNILQNDLNTPAALAFVNEIAQQLNAVLIDSSLENRYNNVKDFTNFLKTLDVTLGLNLMSVGDISADQKQLLEERLKTREQKNWKKSDELRQQLQEQGVGIRDTDNGAIWYWL